MDDEVERLERALRQDPSDASAAARLEAALLRAGRREELGLRYHLGMVCPVYWNNMAPTADAQVRRCEQCRRDVHTAGSYAEFDRLAVAGHCVAVVSDALPAVIDELITDDRDAQARGWRSRLSPTTDELLAVVAWSPPPGGPCLVQRPDPRMVIGRPAPLVPIVEPQEPPPTPDPMPTAEEPRPGLLARLRRLFGR